VRFEFGDIGEWKSSADFDLVLAAQVCSGSDHIGVLARWTALFDRAVRSPFRCRQRRHALAYVARLVAEREPYMSLFGPDGPPSTRAGLCVAPEEYATIFYDLGFERQHVGCRSIRMSCRAPPRRQWVAARR